MLSMKLIRASIARPGDIFNGSRITKVERRGDDIHMHLHPVIEHSPEGVFTRNESDHISVLCPLGPEGIGNVRRLPIRPGNRPVLQP